MSWYLTLRNSQTAICVRLRDILSALRIKIGYELPGHLYSYLAPWEGEVAIIIIIIIVIVCTISFFYLESFLDRWDFIICMP